MRQLTLFSLDTPYRETLSIRGFEFGDPEAEPCVAIVGAMRGNEYEQNYICADLVRRLQDMEAAGITNADKRVLVVPSVNPFSMNVSERFWPVDHTDINRMFPGYSQGETTQRIAAGLFSAVSPYAYGIQLCSYYLSGDFTPHVRITRANELSDEAVAMADDFGFPYVLVHEPNSFDTTTLNYNWQVWETRAFSVYSRDMGGLDVEVAATVQDNILRFLAARGVLDAAAAGGYHSLHISDADLVRVRTKEAGGFFVRSARVGQRVRRGQQLGFVVDAYDGHVREELVSPLDARVFFSHVSPTINQYTLAFSLAPSVGWEHAQ